MAERDEDMQRIVDGAWKMPEGGFVCPDCGYVFELASGVGPAAGATPDHGSLSLCIRCAGVSLFVSDGPEQKPTRLEKLSVKEMQEVLSDPHVTQLRAEIIGLASQRTEES